MAESILFMLSSILTARFLEKRKMQFAGALYSVIFTVILVLLVFALDIPLFQSAMTNLCGEYLYEDLHLVALKVLNKTVYGMSIITMIALTISVQLGIIIYTAMKTIVHAMVKRAPARKFIRVYTSRIKHMHEYFPRISINRLYCRMLN